MQPKSDTYSVNEENEVFKLAIYSVIGDRKDQQDSSGYSISKKDGAVVVCDGMGGYENGRLASSTAVDKFLSIYESIQSNEEIFDTLCNAAHLLDEEIVKLSDKYCESGLAGTTLAAAIVRDNLLYWLSVGDSRIYVKRGSEFVQITRDHNYGMVLDGKVSLDGAADDSETEREILISFLGTGGLPVIDCKETPFLLESEDKILIMSDGLYKLLSDEDIFNIINNFSAGADALSALNMKAARAAKKRNISRDNMTLAIITMK